MHIILLIILLLTPAVRAENLPDKNPALFPAFESIRVLNFSHPSGEPRSSFTMDFRTVNRGPEIVYEITAQGKGAFHKYRDAEWTVISQLISDGEFMKPRWTRTEIRDLTDPKTIWLETRFDYATKKITFSEQNSKQKTIKTYVFPIKGLTVDYASMHYFLKPFIARLPKEKNQSFYLLSIEPALYNVDIKLIQTEKLTLPRGTPPGGGLAAQAATKTALKIRLLPNFGILDAVLDNLVPPTFLWYEDHPPYNWLKYQGLETGLHSPNISAYLSEPDNLRNK